MSGSPLTLEERYSIYLCDLAGLPVSQIARGLSRHRSTVHAELVRGRGGPGGRGRYCPHRAHWQRLGAGASSAANARCLSARQWQDIGSQLRAGLSPEQVSGWRERTGSACCVSTQAIYNASRRYAWGHLLPHGRLRAHRARPTPHPYSGRARPIHERSQWARHRRQRGHWEADTMVGKRSDTKRVLLIIERATLLTRLVLLDGSSSDTTAKRLLRCLARAPICIRSLTTDRGSEFAALADHLPGQAFVCDARRPNQRGTNENQIGLLRRYLPKGKSLRSLTSARLKRLEHWLNNLPRKCLGFRSANEVVSNGPSAVARRT
jgi:transposase, IS30 family